jgi:hypothetical protein
MKIEHNEDALKILQDYIRGCGEYSSPVLFNTKAKIEEQQAQP